MKCFVKLLILLLLFISSEVSGKALNLVIIGWEGMDRADFNQQLSLGNLPSANRIIQAGGKYDLTAAHGVTQGKPGWTSIMTGMDPEMFGIYSKNDFEAVPNGYTLFEKLKAMSPNMVLGWYTAREDGATNCAGVTPFPFKNICDGEILPENKREVRHLSNDSLASSAIDFIGRNANTRFSLFLLFDFPDRAGHLCNYDNISGNIGYIDSVIATPVSGSNSCVGSSKNGVQKTVQWGYGADYWTGQIMDYMQSLGVLNDTVVVVTSSHGFNLSTHDHLSSPNTWMIYSEPLRLTGAADTGAVARTLLDNQSFINWQTRKIVRRPW